MSGSEGAMDAHSGTDAEDRRIAAVHALRLLDTPAEQRFDRITRMARELFRVPVAEINLIDEARQFTKSPQPPGASPESPRSQSFCGVAIQDPGILVVPDASADPRFSWRDGVTGARGIRFYAGRSLEALDGQRVGTLCLVDTTPRRLSDDELTLLEALGHWVERELRDLTDRDQAGDVQQSLLPDDLTDRADVEVAGIHVPGRQLTSTFYDWSEEDERIDLTLAEVTGTGPGAAVLGASIRSAIKARAHLPPGAAVREVQEQLAADLILAGTTATLFHARFDRRSGRLEYVDAGHGLAAVVRAAGTSEDLAPCGLPLGVAARTGWTEKAVQLERGDALVLTTGDLLDAYGAPGDMSVVSRFALPADGARRIAARMGSAAEEVDAELTAIVLTRPRRPQA